MSTRKTFKEYVTEDSPLTSTGPGIDLAPTARTRKLIKPYKVIDRRSRYDVKKMYEKSLGLKSIPTKSE